MNKVKQINEYLDSLIYRMGMIPFNAIDGNIADEFKLLVSAIERSKKEFESTLFLILAFGPVKSGKSTLINLLARQEEVSPTKFGIECTLRPSIIIKAKNRPCIKRYFSKTSQYNQQSERENFNKVLDYIRGIATKNDLMDYVNIEEHEFSLDRVSKFVAGGSSDYGEISKEPLITVIEVDSKDSRLVDENTAIVDVPGLDGVLSNWRESPVHDWILTRSDFLLFVQSSIAALNIETISFLKEVYINSKEPPMNLVQNIIEAKSWRGKQYLMEEAAEQRKKGIDQILSIIPQTKNSEFDSTQVNLGLAHDVVFNKVAAEKEETLKECGFTMLEQKLVDILEMRREDIQLSNSLKSLKRTLMDTLSAFENFVLETDKKMKEIEDAKRSFNLINTSVNNLLLVDSIQSIFKKYNQVELDVYLNRVTQKYLEVFNNCFKAKFSNAFIEGTPWKKLKMNMKEYVEQAYQEFENLYFNFRSNISYDIVADINKTLYSVISDSLFDEHNNVRQILLDAKISETLHQEDYMNIIDKKEIGMIFKSANINDIDFVKIDDKKGLIKKEMSLDKTKDENYKAVNSVIEKHLETVFKKELLEFFDIALRKASNKINQDVQKIRQPFDVKMEEEVEQCLIVRKYVDDLKPEIEEKVIWIGSQI